MIDDAGLVDEVVSVPTLGQMLRQERELRDIPLDRIEEATRIRSAQLRAIEDDRLEALPAEAYARGFVRTYAEYLGLNGDDVVAIFNEQWNRSAHRAEPALPQTPVSVARSSPAGLFSLWVALACLLLAGSAVLYLMGGSGGGHAAPPPPATQPPATQPVTSPDDQRNADAAAGTADGRAYDRDRGAGQLLAGGASRLRDRGTAGRADAGAGPGRAPARPPRVAAAGGSDQRPVAGERHTLDTAYPAQPINLLVTPHGATQL